MRQLVDHQVVAFPAAAGLHARPGEDHRTLLPGFAAVLAIPLVDHAAGVAVALWADEVIRVQDDLVEALVPVEVGQVQQRQLGLCRQRQTVDFVQLDAGQGAQVLAVQKQHRTFAQALFFVVGQAVENWQALAHGGPGDVCDWMAGKDALAAPGAERPHVQATRWMRQSTLSGARACGKPQ
ncbi:hypothetical protein D9M68_750600 [compost metagenome]